MQPITFVGLDVHKATIAVSVAEGGRDGEVRHLGRVENRPEVVRRLVERLRRGGQELRVCYEAGPCGCGLHRQLTERSNSETFRLRHAGSRKNPMTRAEIIAARSWGFLWIRWSSEMNAHPPSCPSAPSHSTSRTRPVVSNFSHLATTVWPSGAATAASA